MSGNPTNRELATRPALTVLGYETKPLGQGQGRVPDGQALNVDDSYAILWDAKVRGDRYNMGTDDRAVRKYITTQSRELKKKRGPRNIYYLTVSSEFADDYHRLHCSPSFIVPMRHKRQTKT